MKLVPAIDVSNYQPADLTQLIKTYKAEHVVVRLSTERQAFKDQARDQFKSALDNGCTISGYVWSYFELDPTIHTREALQVGEGYPLSHIWFDCESPPRINNLDDWLSTATAFAEKSYPTDVGVYTTKYWWESNRGSDAFGRLLLWVADWDERPYLDTAPFGGWGQVHGKQWTSTNETMDRNVFDSSIFGVTTSLKGEIERVIIPEIDALKAKLQAILAKY